MKLQQVSSRQRAKPLSERQQRIYRFLDEQHLGVLSTVTPNNDPHGAVIYYAIEDDFTVWFLTKTRTRKSDNLLHNNHVMLTVCEPATQAVVQVLGIAIQHPTGPAVNRVSNEIFKKMLDEEANQLPPIVKLQAGAFTTFEIKPVQIRMAVYAQPEIGDTEELFESIESFTLHEH